MSKLTEPEVRATIERRVAEGRVHGELKMPLEGEPMLRDIMHDVGALTLMIDSTKDEETKEILRTAIRHSLSIGLGVDFDRNKLEVSSAPLKPIGKDIVDKMLERHNEDNNEAGWIEWNGGECPVGREQKVEVRFRCGPVAAYIAKYLPWAHSNGEGDIIAYRLAK